MPPSYQQGHPDKVCDQVSDAVLDTCLTSDPKSKVACETATKDNMVMVAGEITTQAKIDYEAVVRGVEPYTKDGIKFFEWENAKDLSKFKGMSSAQVAAEVVGGRILAATTTHDPYQILGFGRATLALKT